jgi:hypothetical protein
MKRVLAVVLIATLTTLMLGIDRTSWAQERDAKKIEKQQAAVAKALRDMHRGSTATLERTNGEKIDVVIEEIRAQEIVVMREQRDRVGTETIPIADIAKIKKASLRRMNRTSKVLIGTAVAVGALLVAGVAACASASGAQPGPNSAHPTHE